MSKEYDNLPSKEPVRKPRGRYTAKTRFAKRIKKCKWLESVPTIDENGQFVLITQIPALKIKPKSFGDYQDIENNFEKIEKDIGRTNESIVHPDVGLITETARALVSMKAFPVQSRKMLAEPRQWKKLRFLRLRAYHKIFDIVSAFDYSLLEQNAEKLKPAEMEKIFELLEAEAVCDYQHKTKPSDWIENNFNAVGGHLKHFTEDSSRYYYAKTLAALIYHKRNPYVIFGFRYAFTRQCLNIQSGINYKDHLDYIIKTVFLFIDEKKVVDFLNEIKDSDVKTELFSGFYRFAFDDENPASGLKIIAAYSRALQQLEIVDLDDTVIIPKRDFEIYNIELSEIMGISERKASRYLKGVKKSFPDNYNYIFFDFYKNEGKIIGLNIERLKSFYQIFTDLLLLYKSNTVTDDIGIIFHSCLHYFPDEIQHLLKLEIYLSKIESQKPDFTNLTVFLEILLWGALKKRKEVSYLLPLFYIYRATKDSEQIKYLLWSDCHSYNFDDIAAIAFKKPQSVDKIVETTFTISSLLSELGLSEDDVRDLLENISLNVISLFNVYEGKALNTALDLIINTLLNKRLIKYRQDLFKDKVLPDLSEKLYYYIDYTIDGLICKKLAWLDHARAKELLESLFLSTTPASDWDEIIEWFDYLYQRYNEGFFDIAINLISHPGKDTTLKIEAAECDYLATELDIIDPIEFFEFTRLVIKFDTTENHAATFRKFLKENSQNEVSRLKISKIMLDDMIRWLPLISRLYFIGKFNKDFWQDRLNILFSDEYDIKLDTEKQQIVEGFPEFNNDLKEICYLKEAIENNRALPKSISKAIDYENNLKRQLEQLEILKTQSDKDPKEIENRISNLTKQLDDKERLERECLKALKKAITKLLREYRYSFAIHAVNELYTETIRSYLGDSEETLKAVQKASDDLMNAIWISSDAESNNRIGRKIVLKTLQGDDNWYLRHGSNQRFLSQMKELGIDSSRWLEGHSVQISGLQVYTEDDPLKVMQMGNYFDTCLSRGKSNQHSTIANAVDVNKKVIYIKDKKNNIVGRKLIGLTSEGKIVGFRSYGSAKGNDGVNIRRVFEKFCLEFAEGCRTTLANLNRPATLVAKSWYDDGLENFSMVTLRIAKSKIKSNDPETRLAGFRKLNSLRNSLYDAEVTTLMVEVLLTETIDDIVIQMIYSLTERPNSDLINAIISRLERFSSEKKDSVLSACSNMHPAFSVPFLLKNAGTLGLDWKSLTSYGSNTVMIPSLLEHIPDLDDVPFSLESIVKSFNSVNSIIHVLDIETTKRFVRAVLSSRKYADILFDTSRFHTPSYLDILSKLESTILQELKMGKDEKSIAGCFRYFTITRSNSALSFVKSHLTTSGSLQEAVIEYCLSIGDFEDITDLESQTIRNWINTNPARAQKSIQEGGIVYMNKLLALLEEFDIDFLFDFMNLELSSITKKLISEKFLDLLSDSVEIRLVILRKLFAANNIYLFSAGLKLARQIGPSALPIIEKHGIESKVPRAVDFCVNAIESIKDSHVSDN